MSVTPLAPAAPYAEKDEAQPEPEVAPLVLEAGGQLSWSVGGKRPTQATLSIKGVPKLNGEFEKGEVIELKLQIQVVSVAFKDEIDKATGQAIDCVRQHVGEVVAVSRA